MVDVAEICIDVWGDFAMFTRPDSKVERMTYEVPTPSACRGILNAIYSKPKEFYYEITQIDVMRPIKTVSIRKNEITDRAEPSKASVPGYCIDTVKDTRIRTQRMNVYLRDVYYRIHANLVKRDDAPVGININKLSNEFRRRVSKGKCFFQPALGTRECVCYFSEPDMNEQPIHEDMELGTMLYDVFDVTKDNSERTLDTRKKSRNICTKISFFNAVMVNGSIAVPLWSSDAIKKG